MGFSIRALAPYVAIFSGVVLIALGAGLGWGAFPNIVRSQVEENIDLNKTDSEGYKNFVTPPVPVYMRFTFFEVQNPINITVSNEKPKFVERGPYVYKEVRMKQQMTPGDGYLDFGQYRHFEFDVENSCEGCKKEDDVTILNMPLVGAVTTALEQGMPLLVNLALDKIVPGIDPSMASTDLFLKDSVDNILFSGVKNRLVDLLMTDTIFKSRLPPAIQANGFAIFNSKNATTKNECYRVDTGVEKHSEIQLWGPDLTRLMSNLTTMKTCYSVFNGSTPGSCKPWWPNSDITGAKDDTPCNRIRGTNAEQFPPFLYERKEDKLWIFTTDLCRSLYLRYLEAGDIDGISTLRYSVPRESTQINLVDNVCACTELAKKWNDKCIKKTEDPEVLNIDDCSITTCHDGLQDVSKCMLSPVIMSSPHFYLAEQQLKLFDESFAAPDETKDMTYLDIEPITGTVLRAHKRIQVNMPVVSTGEDYPQIEFLVNIQHFPAFPVVWLDEGADIDQENIDKIKSMVTTPILLLDITKITLLVLGGLAILSAAGLLLFCK